MIVTSTSGPLSMHRGIHLVSCFRLSGGKKGTWVFLPPFLPENREFCTFDFQRIEIEWLEVINTISPSSCFVRLAEQPTWQWTIFLLERFGKAVLAWVERYLGNSKHFMGRSLQFNTVTTSSLAIICFLCQCACSVKQHSACHKSLLLCPLFFVVCT